jgi:NAD(P)-dependent dehydrogenase (short-subunit alcohol dehydrogenase family)
VRVPRRACAATPAAPSSWRPGRRAWPIVAPPSTPRMSAASPPRHAVIVGGARGRRRRDQRGAAGPRLAGHPRRSCPPGRRSWRPEGPLWRRCDAADPDEAQALLAAAAPYDALVIAAGSYSRRGLFDETAEGFRAQLRDNLDVAFHLLRLGLPPLMAQGWGRVLTFTLSTTHRLQPSPRLPAHAAAKAALLSLTRSAAYEAGPHGVTVNALALGHIQTEHQHARRARPAWAHPAPGHGARGRERRALSVERRGELHQRRGASGERGLRGLRALTEAPPEAPRGRVIRPDRAAADEHPRRAQGHEGRLTGDRPGAASSQGVAHPPPERSRLDAQSRSRRGARRRGPRRWAISEGRSGAAPGRLNRPSPRPPRV